VVTRAFRPMDGVLFCLEKCFCS